MHHPDDPMPQTLSTPRPPAASASIGESKAEGGSSDTATTQAATPRRVKSPPKDPSSYAIRPALANPYVQRLIDEEKLTLEQVLTITDAAGLALYNPYVQKLIDEEKLTLEQVLEITHAARLALANPYIQRLIAEKKLALKQVLEITHAARLPLCSPHTQKLIAEKKLTLTQVLRRRDTTEFLLLYAQFQRLTDTAEMHIPRSTSTPFKHDLKAQREGRDTGAYSQATSSSHPWNFLD